MLHISDIVKKERVETNPTEAEIRAGNYKKGKISIHGIRISIENPKGSVRSGVDDNGKKWKTKFKNTYGYILNTIGKDKDHIDVFLNDNATLEDFDKVYVVDQFINRKFDESKVMMGFKDKTQAKKAYLSNYEKGWKGCKYITEVDLSDFKKWISERAGIKQIKPFHDYNNINKIKLQENDNIIQNNAENEQPKLLLLRGAPGSGKSTYAKKLVDEGKFDEYVEADMFFYDKNGDYKWSPEKLKDAHEWCQKKVTSLLFQGKNVIVSNTSTKDSEVNRYKGIAELCNAVFMVKTLHNNYGNIHNVPNDVVMRMSDNLKNTSIQDTYNESFLNNEINNLISNTIHSLLCLNEQSNHTYQELFKPITDLGYHLYLVGGTVRDKLMGTESNDIDLTTDCPLEKIIDLMDGHKIDPAGMPFGHINVDGYDIGEFREDVYGDTNDGRHPIGITKADTIEKDLSRRDFTMNAIAHDINGKVIDPFGGIDDIKNGIIRFVGNPADKLQQDNLRALRAFRFASRYGFDFAPETWDALKKHTSLQGVSADRIGVELKKILETKDAARVIDLMSQTKILYTMIPELYSYYSPSIFADTCKNNNGFVSRMAALLCKIPSIKTVEEILRRLKYKKNEIDSISWIINNQINSNEIENKQEFEKREFAGHKYHDSALPLFNALSNDKYGEWFEKFKEKHKGVFLPEPKVTAKDLLDQGYKPGKELGEKLRQLYIKQLNEDPNVDLNISESNHRLLGRYFQIPEALYSELEQRWEKVKDNPKYSNIKGYKRLHNIIKKNGNLSYEMLNRIKNYFDYFKGQCDKDKEDVHAWLNGGYKLKQWVNHTLGSAQRQVKTSKKIAADYGINNSFKTAHTRKNNNLKTFTENNDAMDKEDYLDNTSEYKIDQAINIINNKMHQPYQRFQALSYILDNISFVNMTYEMKMKLKDILMR